MKISKLKNVLRCGTAIGLAALVSFTSQAGDFDLSWGSLDWPTDSIGPVTFTVSDEFGYEIQLRIQMTRTGGTALIGYPDDLLSTAENSFGTIESLWAVWDAASGNGSIGQSTNTITFEILSQGNPLALDDLVFEVLDIDAVDNNSTADRCDFVTLTGNAGVPILSYKISDPSVRSVIIGPTTGSGSTGSIAANQAQCIYNIGSTISPTSNGDDYGTIIADYPAGTHTLSIDYDESIANVLGMTSVDPAARGIGLFAGALAVVDNSITLEKSANVSGFTSAGDIIPYTFTITNNGPLPINPGQTIEIQDDKIGTFTCGTVSSAILPGETHSCVANYTVTTTDETLGFVTNNAIAGVGTNGQSFVDRLQSNTDQVTVFATPSGNLTCPIGMNATNGSGTASSIVIAALNSSEALGIPEPSGTIADNSNSSRLVNNSPTLVLDLNDIVPGNAYLPLTIARNNSTANYTISTSLDDITYSTVDTFNGGVLDELQLLNITVPDQGARYVRFQRNAGSLWVGGVSYNNICEESASLVGSKSVSVWDPDDLDLYAIPGNDVIYSITGRNEGAGATDTDSVVLIDTMPAEVEFYNGDIDDDGPETDAVIFAQTSGAGLTFSSITDVRFSNSGTRPVSYSECNYLPISGYDSDVTFICFNPKGALNAGSPSPEFTVSFRARIR